MYFYFEKNVWGLHTFFENIKRLKPLLGTSAFMVIFAFA